MPKLGLVVALCGIGLLAAAMVPWLAQLSLRKIVLGSVGLGVLALALRSRHRKAVFLFAWVFSLTYNRAYYPLDSFANTGAYALYWIPSDIFLLALLGGWAYETLILRRASRPRGARLWPWSLPFLVVALLSVLGADRLDWALVEIGRLARMVVLLLYLRCNLGRREWWAATAALGCAILPQAFLGVLQAGGRRGGVLSLFGVSEQLEEVGEAWGWIHMGGWFRAEGTIGHPAGLACYFLLAIPVMLALGLTLPNARLRISCALAGLIGLVGLACTLSRVPWILSMAQIGCLGVGLVCLRAIPLKRMVGLASVGGLLVLLALLPLRQTIQDRVTRDFDESFALRAKDRRVVLAMVADNFFLGVGLNNYLARLARYDSDMEFDEASVVAVRQERSQRAIVAPHNLYLLILAETGILGLACFVLFLTGVLVRGVRAIVSAGGVWSTASLGLVLGIGAVLGQSLIDASVWVDPVLYTSVLMVGLLNLAPQLATEDRLAVPK